MGIMPKSTSSRGRKAYQAVNIPRPMYEAIRNLVENGKLAGGYVSADDFIRDAIRRRLRDLGYDDRLLKS